MNTATIQHEFTQKVCKGIFRPVKRHLSETAIDNDRYEEGLASAWNLYSKKATVGETVPDAILVHHCRLRATDLSRNLVGNGGRRREDVLDPRSYSRGKVELANFGEVGHAVLGQTSPEGDLVSALDLQAWLLELADKDRKIVTGKAEGLTLKEIGRKVGMSFSGVRGRLQRLGEELAERAGLPVPATV